MALRTLTLAAVVAVAFADYYYTAAPATTASKCYATGERCMGEKNYPYVEYKPCCDADGGVQCLKADDWGYKCALPSPPKCYMAGERCMGQKGYPYVPYAECCGYGECLPVKGEWGKFCIAPKAYPVTLSASTAAPKDYKTTESAPPATTAPKYHYGYKTMASTAAPVVTTAKPSYYYGKTEVVTLAPKVTTLKPKNYGTYKAPKCYENGERCVGAKNKPYVPWAPCCDPAAIQIESRVHGYGKFCLVVMKPEMPTVCYVEGSDCGKAYRYKCCEGTSCVSKPYGYGYYCVAAKY